MKNYIVLFSVFSLFFCEVVYAMNPLNITNAESPFYSADLTFSLIPPYEELKTYFPIVSIRSGVNPYIITETFANSIAPTVGYYHKLESSRPLYWLVQLRPDMVLATVPDSVGKVIAPFLNEVKRIDYTISFWGPGTQSKTNLRFHAWARSWANDDPSAKIDAKENAYFEVNVPMGIFEADGIAPDTNAGGIAFDKLTEQNISVHRTSKIGGYTISPDNARFLVDQFRDISSFWVVAHSPNKKYLCLTYIILINSDAENKLRGIFDGTKITLGGFIGKLEMAAKQLTSPNRETLEKIVRNIRTILKGERVSPIAEPSSKDPLNIARMEFDPFDITLIKFSMIPPHTELQTPPFLTAPGGSKFKIKINPFDNSNVFTNSIAPTVAYYDEPTSSRPPYGFIQLRPDIILATVPNSVKQVIAPFLNKGVKRLDYNISFWGPGTQSETNLRFHAWVRSWAEYDTSAQFTPPTQGVYFNVDVPMGIFEADGIAPDKSEGGLAFGKLTKQNILIHGHEGILNPVYGENSNILLISPNNARFLVDKHRDISSFWVVAHSPNEKYLCLTYIILINSVLVENKLKDIFDIDKTSTLGDFISKLEAAAKQFTSPNREILEKIVRNIRTILKGGQVSSIAEPPVAKSPAELIQALRKFEQSLKQLINFL